MSRVGFFEAYMNHLALVGESYKPTKVKSKNKHPLGRRKKKKTKRQKVSLRG